MSVIPLPVAANHPAYDGHFPGRPILPGVVLLDAALHALATQHTLQPAAAQFKSAKFLNPVLPGEALALHYAGSPVDGFRFDIRCGDRIAASGSVVFSLSPERP